MTSARLRVRAFVLSAAVLAFAACGRESRRRIDAGEFDPTGRLSFTRDGKHYALLFPEMRWPRVGEMRLATGPIPPTDVPVFGLVNGAGLDPVEARIVVRRFDSARIDCQLVWNQHQHEHTFLLYFEPTMRRWLAPEVSGRPVSVEAGVPGVAEDADFVVCLLGAAGTGLAGQHRVARSIEVIARDARPDLILVLGDLLMPDGVRARGDALWRERFEAVYPSARFPFSFRFVLGAAEHRGDVDSIVTTCATHPRLSTDPLAGVLEERAGDTPVTLVTLDSTLATLPIHDPRARRARTRYAAVMSEERPGWRVVASYHPLFGHGDAAGSAASKELERVAGQFVDKYGLDLWLSGASRSMELVRDARGTLHIGCGAGAGPELAQSVNWESDTLFASTGGGTVWLRFHGEHCEVTCRDSDGKVLFVHDETRRAR